jgi:hypothetical protein
VRTDDGNEWRYRSIERASEFFDVNRSDAVAYACDAAVELVDGAEEVLERDDLTQQQRREIAEALSTGPVSFEVEEPSVDVDRG